MNSYEELVIAELKAWQQEMAKKPSFTNKLAKDFQNKLNNIIPEKVHLGITTILEKMSKSVLYGSKITSSRPLKDLSLLEREIRVKKKIDLYKKVGAASGAWIGAGGLLLALADLPILISVKIKLLFSIAGIYGFDIRDFQERLFILYIFQLAFSSQAKKVEVYKTIFNWEEYKKTLPKDFDGFDWRSFQQEYRDSIDIAKLLQLIPGIGAFIGAYANHQLLEKLGETAINSYRLRILNSETPMLIGENPFPIKK